MLSDEQKKQIDSIIQTQFADFLRNLPTRIDKILESVVLASLGLRKSYDKYEIDHCNGLRAI